jgi:hypothetical protein
MAKKLFQPGHTGRPKGTRNKLAIQVFEDVLQHWNEPIEEGSERRKGPEALELCFKENPGEYLRFVGQRLPQELSSRPPRRSWTTSRSTS